MNDGLEKEVAPPLTHPANELYVFQTHAQCSWQRAPVKQQDQVFPPDQPRVLQLLLEQPSLCRPALLTDAQLVSDGLGSHVLNGAGIKMKAGGTFMYTPSLRSIYSLCLSIRKLNDI